MSPQRSNLVLTTNIPHIKLDILVGDRLDVEAHCGDCRHILAELELVENGCLAGSIETEHEKSHFFGSEDLAHHFGELTTHDCSLFDVVDEVDELEELERRMRMSRIVGRGGLSPNRNVI